MNAKHAESAQSQENITAENKKIVAEFYREFYVNQKLDVAPNYLSENIKQHRPNIGDGRKAMVDEYVAYLKDHHNHKEEIKRVIAEGDLVAVHAVAIDEPDKVAVVDIFRVQNGKIVEHWDVCQAVPEKSANSNTMF
ncbi:MAG: ester cyclase [Candidatus Sulfotelmatobacter sp.]|jgi:predicted SnoaL-like aldol condensation-catalyzing enzyme